MKIHNGGAISGTCQYLEDQNLDDFEHTSGRTMFDDFNLDERVIFTAISGLFTQRMEVNKFVLKDNEFIENFSGLKGTALMFKQYSHVLIDNCNFYKNGPVFSAIEKLYSPFSKMLA